MIILALTVALSLKSGWCIENTQTPQPDLKQPQIRYKASKDLNFEQLIIQGQLKHPEITVVTGNTDQGVDGLLRLRENFLDHAAIANGEAL